MFKQVLPGSELVLAELSDSHEVPSYYLSCDAKAKIAYLILPGTRNTSDIVTDFNAEAEEIPGGLAHRGMVKSAKWLVGELSPALVHLYTRGYQVIIIGHSLGAAVGALLTVLLRPQIASLKCFGFGTPACVDEQLMCVLLDCMVSVVNRDDVVPRLNVHNVEALAQSALCAGQVAKTKAWMDEDWKAIKDVERIVELRRRSAPEDTSSGSNRWVLGSASSQNAEKEEKIARLCAAGVARGAAERALEQEGGDLNRALLRATEEESASPQAAASEQDQVMPSSSSTSAQQGADGTWTFGRSSTAVLGEITTWASSAWPIGGIGQGTSDQAASDNARCGPTELEQHPRFFVPGQIIHLYQRDGLSRAALASCTHETFAHIFPTQEMLEDHKVRSYDEALRQACIETPKTPRWESFDERKTCACCSADFNWAYVLKSEPQRALARHNCFSCGKVVCGGCSQHRLAHQQLGFVLPVRTCDKCFFDPSRA